MIKGPFWRRHWDVIVHPKSDSFKHRQKRTFCHCKIWIRLPKRRTRGGSHKCFFRGGLPYGKGSADPPPPRSNRVSGKSMEGSVINPGHCIRNEGWELGGRLPRPALVIWLRLQGHGGVFELGMEGPEDGGEEGHLWRRRRPPGGRGPSLLPLNLESSMRESESVK